VGLLLFFIIINIYCVLSFPMDLKELMILLWGKIYITSFFAFFLWLRALDNGFMLLLSVFLTIWASDTGAYLCGITLGRNKLMPAVSPKKSVEGALGGLLFAAIIMLMMAPYLTLHRFTAVFVGLGLSILGQCGDLAESALKRWGNSKDSGIFLPGHGGVLDRLDSLLFAVPVAYYLFLFLIPGRGL
ncbi:MAG: phosphatidate cytidylyltransferase, partial [Firmicutes bacterium]|nr:phosphatidate cytidylyltransferase [Bacillota bacterium]